MKPSKETVKKLRKLQAFIRKEPRRFDMSCWGAAIKGSIEKLDPNKAAIDQNGLENYGVSLHIIADNNPPCGTVACLAGSVLMMAGLIKPKFIKTKKDEVAVFDFGSKTPSRASDYLGITPDDENKLFYLDGWQARFSYAYWSLSNKQQVERACKRLDHYIETGK